MPRPPNGRWASRHLVLLAHNLRYYHALVRPFHTLAAQTPYTRLQLVHSLWCYLCLSGFMGLVFLGSRQCTGEKKLLAGLLSALCSSALCMLGRLIFLWARNRGELRVAFQANEVERRAATDAVLMATGELRVDFQNESPGCVWASGGPHSAKAVKLTKQASHVPPSISQPMCQLQPGM